MSNRGHRAVGSAEHDPSQSLLHGDCAICVTPWPCDVEKATHPEVYKTIELSEVIIHLEEELKAAQEVIEELEPKSKALDKAVETLMANDILAAYVDGVLHLGECAKPVYGEDCDCEASQQKCEGCELQMDEEWVKMHGPLCSVCMSV